MDHKHRSRLGQIESLERLPNMSSGAPAEEVPADLLAKRDELKAQVDGKQKQLKVVIDKLRTLQDDICLLTCSTISVDYNTPDLELRAGALPQILRRLLHSFCRLRHRLDEPSDFAAHARQHIRKQATSCTL
eukprot:2120055-Rhodomonas_salina.1